jgi:hypothetical protein
LFEPPHPWARRLDRRPIFYRFAALAGVERRILADLLLLLFEKTSGGGIVIPDATASRTERSHSSARMTGEGLARRVSFPGDMAGVCDHAIVLSAEASSNTVISTGLPFLPTLCRNLLNQPCAVHNRSHI